MTTIRIVAILFFAMALAGFSFAHGLNISAKVEQKKLIVTVWFDPDEPAEDCEISLSHANGEKIAVLKANREGIAVFDLKDVVKGQLKSELLLKADNADGHIAKRTISISNIPDDNDPGIDLRRDGQYLRTRQYIKLFFGVLSIGLATWVWLWVKRKK
jgi:hypothetical protein